MSHIGVRLAEAARRLVDLGTLGFVCPFHNLATKTLYYGSTEIDLATLIACPTWPHSAAASAAALTRLTSNEHISQSVSKSPSVSAIAASLQAASAQSNSKYSIASLTANSNVKDEFSSRYHRPQQHPHQTTVSF